MKKTTITNNNSIMKTFSLVNQFSTRYGHAIIGKTPVDYGCKSALNFRTDCATYLKEKMLIPVVRKYYDNALMVTSRELRETQELLDGSRKGIGTTIPDSVLRENIDKLNARLLKIHDAEDKARSDRNETLKGIAAQKLDKELYRMLKSNDGDYTAHQLFCDWLACKGVHNVTEDSYIVQLLVDACYGLAPCKSAKDICKHGFLKNRPISEMMHVAYAIVAVDMYMQNAIRDKHIGEDIPESVLQYFVPTKEDREAHRAYVKELKEVRAYTRDMAILRNNAKKTTTK